MQAKLWRETVRSRSRPGSLALTLFRIRRLVTGPLSSPPVCRPQLESGSQTTLPVRLAGGKPPLLPSRSASFPLHIATLLSCSRLVQSYWTLPVAYIGSSCSSESAVHFRTRYF